MMQGKNVLNDTPEEWDEMLLAEPSSNIAAGLSSAPGVVDSRQSAESVAREIIETLLLTFFIFWLVNSLVGRYRIDGSSMNPTLSDGQYLLINNVSYYLDKPEFGDIIVFHHPRNELNLIKRVIGVSGDHVDIADRKVKVNGVTLDEPYISAEPNYSGSWDVPEGQYFVLGDNRNNSSDSHSWSFLPEENIIGRAMFIYWPPDNWSPIDHFTANAEQNGAP